MADTKITGLTALTGANSAPGDLLTLVDVSDTTMNAAGTNKSITRQELQTYNAGTLTTDVKVLDLSATWNNAGVTFSMAEFAITDTASNSSSLFLKFTVGGATRASLSKWGLLSVSNDLVTSGGKVWIQSGALGFGASYDLTINRDAAEVLAQYRATNAQTFRLYNTRTDASNYERLGISWGSNIVSIKPEAAGTGTVRVLHISGLPTSNPGPGILWNDSNTVKVGT